MVVSVGPYMFSSRRPADHRAASSPEHRSPPVLTVRSAGKSMSGSDSRSEGVLTHTSISRSRSRAPSAVPERTVSRSATCSAAPEKSARKTSSSEASKLSDAVCRTRLPGPAPKVSTACESRLEAAPCVTATPLGCPVEPEV